MVAGVTVASVLAPGFQRLSEQYARALLESLPDDEAAETAAGQLEKLAELLSRLDQADLLLARAEMFHEEGERLIRKAVAGRVLQPVEAALVLMARHGRLRVLPGMARAFRKLLNDRQGVVEVSVTAAAELSAENRQLLSDAMADVLGRPAVLKVRTDRRALGGLLVHVGDRVYDATISSQLKALRRRLISRLNDKPGLPARRLC